MYMRGYSMRDLNAGILGSSRDTASAPRGRTEVELSQSTASVEPDREPSRSAHVPNRCAAGLQDVRIAGIGISMALSTMVPVVWQETAGLRRAQGMRCERSEHPREAAACER